MFASTPILPLEAPLSQLTDEVTEENDLSTEQNNGNQTPATVALVTHTRAIVIIQPPPEIRSMVEKTAQLVSKNGAEFEKRIIASNVKNAKFNFLSGSDPYHAYYQHKLSEFRAQNQDGTQPVDSDAPNDQDG